MKKLLTRFVVLIFTQLVMSTYSLAGGVTDNNNTHPGDILVGVTNQGSNSVGHWTDPSELDSLKGPQGDTGPQGPQGDIGLIGPQGDRGPQGFQGIQGVAGPEGIQGLLGDTGPQGDKGDIGPQGIQGLQGIKGLNGKDVDPKEVKRLDDRINQVDKRVDELEETQINIDGEVIIDRGRRHEIGVYGKYDIRHNRVPEVGVRVSIALEDSYEMKEIDKLNKKLDTMNRRIELSNIETETVIENGKVITRIKK